MEYTAIVTDINGCTAIDSIGIEVADLRNLYVPNAFSPNGDGINDTFTAFGNNAIRIISTFQIYDKWGEQVFSTSDIYPSDLNGGWDGKFKGADSPTGTYIFFMEVIWLDGRVDIVKGAVNLIRQAPHSTNFPSKTLRCKTADLLPASCAFCQNCSASVCLPN